ncbi:YjgN family protein [Citrobacter sp. FP75]|uniref:YjgN family protein n=1 Tax=Citrobacter sp. FP75 TaxID=1852949 RepID=UPI001BC9FA0E|nr:DUF898 family protein [Citrobacter sp. FP75]
MNNVISGQGNQGHKFIFTGKGWEYFIICFVNFLLSCITLGIYMPWAIVKCRRYIYEKMTLNGQPFTYKATGGAIFVSFLLIMVIYGASVSFVAHGSPLIGFTLIGLLVATLPLMAVKSLQYQAEMTSLNGVRFGFNCSKLYAWLYMLAVPLVLSLVNWGVVCLLSLATEWLDGSAGTLFRIAFIALVGIVGIGITYGITYAKWMQLLGNGSRFGIHRFAININMKACVVGCIKAVLVLLPFVVVIAWLIAPIFLHMVMLAVLGVADEEFILEHHSRIMACYFLYFLGIIVVGSYLYVTLRNLFINNLELADGKIRFRSSVTAVGMVWRFVLVIFVSGITFGLAYPWMKMWLVSWLAGNSCVLGDLDSLELTNSDETLATGPGMWVSRGVITYFPFI